MNAITTSDKPLNVGLIGYGLGGATFHAPFTAITPGLHLSAVMTRDPARRAAVAERYPDAGLELRNLDHATAMHIEVIALGVDRAIRPGEDERVVQKRVERRHVTGELCSSIANSAD